MKKSLKLLKKVLREPAVIVLAEEKKTTITNVCAKNSENRSKTLNLKDSVTVCFTTNQNNGSDIMAEITLTKDNFEKEVTASDKAVLIDFWATWCGPCKMIAPFVEQIAEEFSDEVKVCKVNIDDEPSLATKFGITSIPTLLVIKNGEVVKTSVGYIPKEKIIELFE